MTIPSIKCPFCGFTSYHPEDVKQRYCGNCHVFIDDELDRRAVEAMLAEEAKDSHGESNSEA